MAANPKTDAVKNAAPPAAPSNFIRDIIIEDLKTKKYPHFFCDLHDHLQLRPLLVLGQDIALLG